MSSPQEDQVADEIRKPGQKQQTPTPGDADRVFYGSLYKQNPNSHMAQDYMLAYGCLSGKKAEGLLNLVLNRSKVSKSSPGKSSSSSSSVKSEKDLSEHKAKKAKKGVFIDPTAGGDTGFGSSDRTEGIGSMVMN